MPFQQPSDGRHHERCEWALVGVVAADRLHESGPGYLLQVLGILATAAVAPGEGISQPEVIAYDLVLQPVPFAGVGVAGCPQRLTG